VLRTLKLRSILPPEVANLFFHLKCVGNAAVHENVGTTADALSALKIARGHLVPPELRNHATIAYSSAFSNEHRPRRRSR
jgi:hypothetical protein